MFLKSYHHLHTLAQFKSGDVNQVIDVNYILDIFEMTTSTSEPTRR
jgi:hypothetical protein